ncbi:hypothetical protein ACIJDO_000535 [Enterococcus hirae]
MNRGVITNWPFLLLLFGICIGNFVPIEYRTSFNSTDPGIILTKKSYKTVRKHYLHDRYMSRNRTSYLSGYGITTSLDNGIFCP